MSDVYDLSKMLARLTVFTVPPVPTPALQTHNLQDYIDHMGSEIIPVQTDTPLTSIFGIKIEENPLVAPGYVYALFDDWIEAYAFPKFTQE